MHEPGLPLEKFAWLVRALRSFHEDVSVRNTAQFTQMLNRHLTEPLKPATVNRLESAQAEFTVERCQAYERTLGLEPLDLVDCYLYASRLENRTPKTRLARLREPSATDMELLWELAAGESLTPEQWLRLAYLFRNRPDLFTHPRLRDGFLHRLIEDAGNCYEKEERLVREVLITVGAAIMPVLNERVKTQPLRYFNMCEAAGYIPDETGRTMLANLLTETQDGAVTANILESMRRNLDASGIGFEGLGPHLNQFRDYAVNTLQRTDEFFTAREESLAFLRWGKVALTTRERSQLAHVQEDLRQLSLTAGERRRKEVVLQVTRQFSKLLADSALPQGGLPSQVPGIRHFVEGALFTPDRVGRLAAAVLIRPWQLSGLLGEAMGTALTDTIDSQEYGIQRAAVRFLTKLTRPQCLHPVRQLGWSRVQDDSVRLTVGWALGAGTVGTDSALLSHLSANATTTATRRVLAIAAARLGARSVLEDLARGKDTIAAADARQFMTVS